MSMSVKKAPAKKAPAKKAPVTVTIARIEKAGPCWYDYRLFLKRAKGVPSLEYMREQVSTCSCSECEADNKRLLAMPQQRYAKPLARTAPISVLSIRKMRGHWYDWVYRNVLSSSEQTRVTNEWARSRK